jgi:hypothetical protein
MDRYMLMASKLTQLQNLRIGIDYKKMSGQYDRLKKTFLKVPSLEDLIEMLGKISWRLKKVEVDVDKYSYEAWTWKMPKDGLWAGSPQEALLKLVAYERWGLTWSEEKEAWEEG